MTHQGSVTPPGREASLSAAGLSLAGTSLGAPSLCRADVRRPLGPPASLHLPRVRGGRADVGVPPALRWWGQVAKGLAWPMDVLGQTRLPLHRAGAERVPRVCRGLRKLP